MATTMQHPGAGADGDLPQPIRDDLGAPILGPHNVPVLCENSV